YDFIVGQVRRHDRIGEMLSRLDSRAPFIRPMRLAPAVPETKRRPLRPRLQKRLEIPGVIVGLNPRGRRRQSNRVILLTARIVLPTRLLKFPRPPPFSGQADEIPRGFQYIGVNFKLAWEYAVVIAGVLKLPRVFSGENRRPR